MANPTFEITGNVDKNRLFCSGSFSKLLTTYVSLSALSENYNLADIIDDENFFDSICKTPESKQALDLFQNVIGSKFTIHDLCSYYAGLPYTFDISEAELEKVESGDPLKHHGILDEKNFLARCKDNITMLYKPRCKFHYSEISIIFLGYLLEKIFNCKIEDLYNKYILNKFNLKQSFFSRKLLPELYIQDFSDKYDYPSIAILDHGFFCYSNGFFTTLNDMKLLLENLLVQPIFSFMTDLNYARAASKTILNGLTVELRFVGYDILYGYEGLSFSGCNIWCYSTKYKKGYLTFTDDEEKAYNIYESLSYREFDPIPERFHAIYQNCLKNNTYVTEEKNIPVDYQGPYKRVNINNKTLDTLFEVGKNYIVIRNPDTVRYNVIYYQGQYHIKGKDNLPGAHVGFMTSKSGNKHMYLDGTLYLNTNPR